MRRFPGITRVAIGLTLAVPVFAQGEAGGRVGFRRDILPILEAACVKCHGARSNPRGGLRLDLRTEAERGGESGAAIVPGDAAASLLLRRLESADPEERMPKNAAALPPDRIALIRRWIDEGAEWPEDGATPAPEFHWSLRLLAAPPVPETTDTSWPRTPIDAFILAALEGHGWKPAPPADRRTLLRRVTFDLNGLSPTPEELDAFLADPAPDAWERVVDRLLASPNSGERFARHWLDAVHYADTHGHDQDRPRPNAWPYRDWVIRAFNDDKPYARFVEEQLAGDVLFPDDPEAIVATGFIAAGPWDESSQMHVMGDTVDKEIARNLDRDDMVATTMATFTSTTVHCARCHDHKFDPVSQAEYYALQACFAGVDRADRPYDADPVRNRRRQEILRRKTGIAARTPEAMEWLLDPATQEEVAAWERSEASGAGVWTVLDPLAAVSAGGATLSEQDDHSLLAGGMRPETDTYTITAESGMAGITAVRLEVLTGVALPEMGPGLQDNGNLHLSEFRVLAGDRPVALRNPSADFNQEGWTIAHAIDGKPGTAWGIHPEVGKPHVAVFELVEPAGPGPLTFVLEQLHGGHHLIARPRLSATSAARPPPAKLIPDPVAAFLATPVVERSDAQKADLAAWVLSRTLDEELAALPLPSLVYAAASDFEPKKQFTPACTPRPVHVLARGDVRQPGLPASPGALSCVPGLPPRFDLADPADEGARRAALARWITDPRNVLTWRSIVNRVWHHHFGRGLADTPNDFGRMGSQPTHPELLDWLAVAFRDGGGSLKKLHRLILTSAAWMQSCRHDPAAAAADAGNRRLWRMNRTRLDAEQVRDTILQLAGRLDTAMGGPPVKHCVFEDPNPDVTPKADYRAFDPDHPDGRRRSIYRFLFRTLPDPFLDVLDCADGSQPTPVRNVSITALQAMVLMNDPFVVRQSGHLAARIRGAGGRTEQIEALYRLVLLRNPSPDEAEAMSAHVAKHGMANACRVILNTNEFHFVE